MVNPHAGKKLLPRTPMLDSGEFGTICSMWILSCEIDDMGVWFGGFVAGEV